MPRAQPKKTGHIATRVEADIFSALERLAEWEDRELAWVARRLIRQALEEHYPDLLAAPAEEADAPAEAVAERPASPPAPLQEARGGEITAIAAEDWAALPEHVRREIASAVRRRAEAARRGAIPGRTAGSPDRSRRP